MEKRMDIKNWIHRHLLLILLGIQILVLLYSVLIFFRPLSVYSFSGRELLCPEGIFFENFLGSGRDGYYLDTSMVPEETMEKEKEERFTVSTPPINLSRGSYDVSISYQTEENLHTYTAMAKYKTYHVVGEKREIGLNPSRNSQTFSFLSPLKVEDYQLQVSYNNVSYLFVDNISIGETNSWKAQQLFWTVIFCFVLNRVYFYYRKHKGNRANKEQLSAAVVIGLTVFLSSLPLFSYYLYNGHDLSVHLARIEGLKEGLLAGQFPVRMQHFFLDGYGYPFSIFYGDIFLYFPAMLRMIGFTVQDTYKIYLFMVNLGTCLTAYFAGKAIFKDRVSGMVTAFLYMMAPYRLSCMYLRAAVGEVTAMAFFPLVIYGIYGIFSNASQQKQKKKGWIYLALGFSGLINCHIISTFIAALFTAVVCLICWKKTFQKENFISLLKAAGTTLALCSFFLIPFLDYMQFDVRVNHVDKGGIFASHGAFWGQIFSLFPQGYGDASAISNGYADTVEMPFSIGGAFLAVFVIFILIKINLEKEKCIVDKVGNLCFGLGVSAIFMSSFYFPWDFIEQLGKVFQTITQSIQFPWRFLGVATICLSIAGAYTLFRIRRLENRALYYSVLMAYCLLTMVSGSSFFTSYEENISRHYLVDESDVSTFAIGLGEYLPVGTDDSMFGNDTVLAGGAVDILSSERQEDVFYFTCENLSDVPQYADIPLLSYRDYEAKDINTGMKLELTKGEGERIRVRLPEYYEGTIGVQFLVPWYWRIGELVSLGTVLLMFWQWGKNKRKEEGK